MTRETIADIVGFVFLIFLTCRILLLYRVKQHDAERKSDAQ